MEKKEVGTSEERRKKFLLVLPLLVLPFVTMGFWVMGGGKGVGSGIIDEVSGFNPELPVAKVNERRPLDKLAFYDQAEKDSIKWLEKAKQDPYYLPENDLPVGYDAEFNPYSKDADTYDLGNGYTYSDKNEQLVHEKLRQLDVALENAKTADDSEQPPYDIADKETASIRGDVDRLEQMMLMMQGGQREDPEMEQINSVLESILDIQHPERVHERIKQASDENQGQVFAVSAHEAPTPITLLDNKSTREYAEEYQANPQRKENRFFGLDGHVFDDAEQNTIEAVVHETQTLVSGSTVKMRLLNDVYINGVFIPKDNFIFGLASLRGERLEVNVESIRHGNSLFPVKLAVHDLDGISGIHIPGAITRDVAKQSGDQALQGISMGTFNPSLGAQAASAGIELGRNLLSRKIKLVKVEVKAGYKVLLRDGKKREH